MNEDMSRFRQKDGSKVPVTLKKEFRCELLKMWSLLGIQIELWSRDFLS